MELPFDRMINKQHESRSMFVLLQRLKSSAASWEALTGHFYFCTLGIVDRIIARPPLALPGNRSQFSPDLNLSNLFHTQSNLPKFLTSHLEAQSYVRIPKATGKESNSPSLFKVVHYIAKFGENIPNWVPAQCLHLIMPAWCPDLRSASVVRPKCVCRRHIGIFSFQADIGEGVPGVYALGHDGPTNDYSF